MKVPVDVFASPKIVFHEIPWTPLLANMIYTVSTFLLLSTDPRSPDSLCPVHFWVHANGRTKPGKIVKKMNEKYHKATVNGEYLHLVVKLEPLNHAIEIFRNLFCLALKGFNPKSATFRQHYYPEGGWGWVICLCAVLVQVSCGWWRLVTWPGAHLWLVARSSPRASSSASASSTSTSSEAGSSASTPRRTSCQQVN